MIYQTLVVKDTRDVNKCWKWSVIITLLCVVATGLVVTFSFHALLGNFNTNCISGAKLVFKPSDIPSAAASAASPAAGLLATSASGSGTNGSSTEQPGSGPMAAAVDDDQPGPGFADSEAADLLRRQRQRLNFSEQFRAHFEPIAPVSPQLGMSKLRRMTQPNGADEERMEATKRQQLAHNTEDFAFFDSQMIDEVNTYWGPMEPCEYISFVPLIEAIVAIVWVTMFMMCGNGGRSNENFVDEPWRIVLPAFVFFALMTIVSAIHLLVLLGRLAYFCSELKHKLHDQSVPCTLLINQFSINNDDAILPSHNYVLAITFSWLRLLFWALTVAVMSLRCFKGTDFELVESTRAFSAASMAGSGSAGSSARRTRAALLNGYTSGESGAEDGTADGNMVYGVAEQRKKKRQQQLEQRARSYLNNNEPKSGAEEDDAEEEEVEEEEDGESDDTTLRLQDVVVERAPVASGSSVHVNGVEFRPSAQLMQRSGYAQPLRAASSRCPAIAEESGNEQQQQQEQQHSTEAARGLPTIGGSNCRRLVNEIGQVRDANAAKRSKKQRGKDSKA